MTEAKDYDALSQKHLASIKRDMRVSLEDAAVRATHKVMAELEYERGFVHGAQHQMKSSVDKAVNAMAQREWVSLTDEELLKTYGWQFESYGQSDRPSSLGQSIVDEAKQEIIDGLRKVEAKLKEKNDRN